MTERKRRQNFAKCTHRHNFWKKLFQLMALKCEETLTDWKKVRLIPVYKKEDEADTNNHRPISLLSVPSKIMESCVTDSYR